MNDKFQTTNNLSELYLDMKQLHEEYTKIISKGNLTQVDVEKANKLAQEHKALLTRYNAIKANKNSLNASSENEVENAKYEVINGSKSKISGLLSKFKKTGWRGLALSLVFVSGLATSKAKALDYSNTATVSPITTSLDNSRQPIKMFFTDEELIAQGKDPENSCGDNFVYVTPVETKSAIETTSTGKINKTNFKSQSMVIENTDGTKISVGVTKDDKTYSSGTSATTSPNGITTVVNKDNTATIYQNVDGKLMKRTISLEGTKNYSKEEGQFTSEGEVNLAWWGIGSEDLGVDGTFVNSEGSTVIITNNGQTVTTIDHSTGGVGTTTNSQATAKSLLARASYYGVSYYEYVSQKGKYDAGTILIESCTNGTCGIREASVSNGQIQLLDGETVCSDSCYTLS